MEKGDKVVKLILGGGFETASIHEVVAVDEERGLVSLDESHVSSAADIDPNGVGTYRLRNGQACVSYIPGFTSRIVVLED